jgi:hypothetical protein
VFVADNISFFIGVLSARKRDRNFHPEMTTDACRHHWMNASEITFALQSFMLHAHSRTTSLRLL